MLPEQWIAWVSGAVMTALFERGLTNNGRLVEVSMQEAVYASLSSSLGLFMGKDSSIPVRTGNRHGGLAESPYNVYPTEDGYIAIICVGETHWQSLIKAMDRPELVSDLRFLNLASRVAHMDDVDEIVGKFTARFKKEDLFQFLMSHRVPCSPIRDLNDVIHDPHMLSRRFIEWTDHPTLGSIPLQNSPMHYEGTEPLSLVPSHELGQDYDQVYGDWLGLPQAELDSLRSQGVI